MLNISLLLGAASGSSGGSSQGSMVQIGMIVAVFAVFWLLIIRPQRKKQKETKNMLAAIKKGDRVTSIGGIKGVVKNITDKTVVVEVDHKGATLEFVKTAIGSVDVSSTTQETAPSSKASIEEKKTDKTSEDVK